MSDILKRQEHDWIKDQGKTAKQESAPEKNRGEKKRWTLDICFYLAQYIRRRVERKTEK